MDDRCWRRPFGCALVLRWWWVAWKIPEPLRQGFGIDNPWNLVLGEDGRLRPWRGQAEQ